MQLFIDQASDASSDSYSWSEDRCFLSAWGVFNGATLTLEAGFDGVTWLPIATLTAPGMVALDVPNVRLRGTLTGSGATTSVTARLDA